MIVSSFFEMTEFEIFGLQELKSRALWRPIRESYFSGLVEGLAFRATHNTVKLNHMGSSLIWLRVQLSGRKDHPPHVDESTVNHDKDRVE